MKSKKQVQPYRRHKGGFWGIEKGFWCESEKQKGGPWKNSAFLRTLVGEEKNKQRGGFWGNWGSNLQERVNNSF